MASALLLPPVAGESLYGRNGRSATLLLYVEPRTADGQVPPASGLHAWYKRFGLALAIPGAFAEFLAKDLGLGTSDDPPAQLGVWLQSYHPLTTMVDPQGLRTLPGSSPSNWFMGWAFASPDGKPGRETARDLLSQLCEYTLHLDAFEQRLDQISAAEHPADPVKSTWEHRDLPVLAAVIRLLDETATAQVRVSEVAEACGLSTDEVASAVEALDGTYSRGRRRWATPAPGRQPADRCRPAGRRPVAALTPWLKKEASLWTLRKHLSSSTSSRPIFAGSRTCWPKWERSSPTALPSPTVDPRASATGSCNGHGRRSSGCSP